MKVLHVFPSFAVGGAEVRFAALANRFGARWQHMLVALDGRTDCALRISPDVPFTLVPSPVQKGEGPAGLLRIRTALRQLAPAVLVTSNWGSIEWAAAARTIPGLRHVHTEDGFGPDEAFGQKPRRVLARRLVLSHSAVVLPSMRLLAIARDVWRLPERRLHYIPNGLDLSVFAPPPPRGSPEAPLIGTVAKLRPEKNLARLLRAVALLRDGGIAYRLLVVGDGPQRAELEALAAERGIADRVRFAGHVANPAGLYAEMDLFALSSDTEQMPFSVLEAMASALPVASTDVGDVRSMLAAGNAPFLADRDDAALAQALGALIADPLLRLELGRANRAKVERDYDQEKMFQAYAALIDPPDRPPLPETQRTSQASSS